MIIAGLICLLVAVVNIALGAVVDGTSLVACIIFIVLGIWLIYRKATESTRQKETYIKNKEEERKRVIQNGKQRFENSFFTSYLLREFRARNWADLDYSNNGCKVLYNKVETPYKTYIYSDYNLANLNGKGCQELAVYIGESFGGQYETQEITKAWGGYTGGYSGYVGSDGSISVSRDYSGGESTIGYRVYSSESKPAPQPQGKNW